MAEFLHILAEQYDYPQLTDEVLRYSFLDYKNCLSNAKSNLQRSEQQRIQQQRYQRSKVSLGVYNKTFGTCSKAGH